MKHLTAVLGLAILVPVFASAPLRARTESPTVIMKDFDFSPMSISVRTGTKIIWKNLDGEPHTVVSLDGIFRSPALDQDDTFSFRFDKPGTYRYVCSIHPRMMGTVVVTSAQARR